MNQDSKIRFRFRKPPLPARWRWPRGKQPSTARKKCSKCGHLDRAVSSRAQITYYGPARCEKCGKSRRLRTVERPIDWIALREIYAIPRDFVFPDNALEQSR